MKKRVKDERSIANRNKINSEAYIILMIALFSSVIIQQTFLGAPFKQYVVELICFLGMTAYVAIRSIMTGTDLYDGEKQPSMRSFILNSMIAGAVVTTINGFLNYSRYAEHYQKDGTLLFIATLGITFVSAATLTFVVQLCINYFNQKKQMKLEKQLDEEED